MRGLSFGIGPGASIEATTKACTMEAYAQVVVLRKIVNETRGSADAHCPRGPRIGISNHHFGPSMPTIDSRNQPYVEPKLRGRVVCLGYSGRQ